MSISLRQLEYVVALVDCRHFGRAAKRSHVTQPGLSAQLAELERILGVQLFERTSKRVLPTAIGLQIAERSRRLLEDAEALIAAARGSSRPLSGRLRIGVIPTIAPYLLPQLVPQIKKRWPELIPILREEQTPSLLDSLERGELDVLLMALPYDTKSAEVVALFSEQFLVAVPTTHALAKRRRIRESDLENQEVLLLEDGHCLRDHALSACLHLGAVESADVRATSLATLVQMVAAGLGITFLPAMATRALVPAPIGLTILPFSSKRPARTIGLVWRRNSSRRAEFGLLANSIREVLASHR